MRRSLATVALAAAAVLSACGEDGPAIPAPVAAQLSSQVDAIRQAATAGDREGAEGRLAEFRRAVGQLHEAGEVSEDAASRLLARAAVVESALAALPTTTSTETPRAPDKGKDADKEDERKEHGDED